MSRTWRRATCKSLRKPKVLSYLEKYTKPRYNCYTLEMDDPEKPFKWTADRKCWENTKYLKWMDNKNKRASERMNIIILLSDPEADVIFNKKNADFWFWD